jgi:hypothetical protein
MTRTAIKIPVPEAILGSLLAVGLAVGLALALVAQSGSHLVSADGHHKKLTVRVTNVTRGQVLSPPVVVVHGPGLAPLFTTGEPASPELASVAEDAKSDDLVALLSHDPSVRAVVVGAGPIPPGETETVEIDAGHRFDRISIVGMLVTTNDGFYGLRSAASPRTGAVAYELPAYDAGSEANNELCGFIPGPPCGSVGVRDTGDAEGFVHIHAGIHGIGDLVPSRDDWRNPVAKVVVSR